MDKLFSPPGTLPDPGIKPRLYALQTDSLLSEPPGKLCNHNEKKKKKKEILLFVIAWTKLEGIMPGEICQREKDKHYTISLNMYNLKKQIRKTHKLIEEETRYVVTRGRE